MLKRPLDAQNNDIQSQWSKQVPNRLFRSPERKAEVQLNDNWDDVRTVTNIIIDLRDPDSWQRQSYSSTVV